MLTTTTCRRPLSPIRANAHSALVRGDDAPSVGATLANWFGWITLGIGAAVFFGGVSGAWGLGLMGTSVGALVVRTDPQGLMGTVGLAGMVAAPVASYFLYQQPNVNRWYGKHYGGKKAIYKKLAH